MLESKAMYRYSITLVILMALGSWAVAQTPRIQQLEQIGQDYLLDREQAQLRVDAFLQAHPSSYQSFKSNGATYLMIDVTESGVPVYLKTDNAVVAANLNVTQLRAGGSLGLDLQGEGMKFAIWDGGKVRGDHVELVGRITQVDGASTFDDHATHTTGTITASGVNPNAMGMAPKATGLAFDYNNDVSEMASQAKPDQTSILLSNHSYGIAGGWDFSNGSWQWLGDPSISSTEDYKFGFYNSDARAYDNIAFNAPYYLIIKSAGNDREDVGDGTHPADGPFDCITTNGNAKNVLTIGAVKKLASTYTGPSSVQMTSFSSWGPTDDGRIKPDLVAPGENVLSCTAGSTTEYSSFSGTSMASPATTGTLLLLQQLYKNLNGGNYMKAATLKALALHTARECGTTPGPDYSYGWGLLDAEAAANVIINTDEQNVYILEQTLANNGVFELTLNPKQNEKITATLVWTDPAGTPPTPSLDPTNKMLVNDLDLLLVDDGGTQQFPWVLNPASPGSGATRGVNSVDNVEKIEFDSPEPRTYTLKVSHKGVLAGGTQDFSLIVTYASVIDPSISYYWIGDTGDWDNGANWSLTSGGVAANLVPGAGDNVVFDENSFAADNSMITLNQDQSCHSFRWFAKRPASLSMNNFSLSLDGSVNLLADGLTISTPGTFVFGANAVTDQVLSLGNNDLSNLNMIFSGDQMSWVLSGNFTLGQIEIQNGTVEINSGTVVLDGIQMTGSLTKALVASGVTLQPASDALIIDVAQGSASFDNSILTASASTNPHTFSFGANDFAGAIDVEQGSAVISGSGSVNKIMGLGHLTIEGDHLFTDFSLSGGSSIDLGDGTTQTFTDALTLAASPTNHITISSSGSASIGFDGYYKVCFDNLDITNVNVVGTSVVNAGLASTLTNSSNWITAKCEDILFPDFTFTFNCEKSVVFFNDVSTGPISGRTWDFGDPSSLKNSSSAISPIHYFEAIGTHSVTLQITDGVNTKSFTQILDLASNVIPDNSIVINNNKLSSFLPASKYQWIRNDTLIENSDSRSIDFVGKPGEYAVLTFDQACNKRSALFVVTSVAESINQLDEVQVFPNPVQDLLWVKATETDPVLELRLMDQSGRRLSIQPQQYQNTYSIPVSEFTPGLYVLTVLTKEHFLTKKILIH